MPVPKKKVKNNKPLPKPKSNIVKKEKVVKVEKKFETRTIDAKGEILGRLSTRIANILRGKDKPSFRPYLVMGDKVVVINAGKIKVTGNKMEQKIYYHHTGYIGHLKSETLKEVMKKDPTEVIRRAVFGMLPKNKLRNIWMKNLEIRKEE